MIQYMKVSPLSEEILQWNQKIEAIAKDEGLDFFETRFLFKTNICVIKLSSYCPINV